MNNPRNTQPVHPEASLREAGLDDLIKDVSRIGPAPSRSREAFVIVVLLVLLGAVIGIAQPGALFSALLAAGVVAYIAVRWILGTRKWGQR